MSLQNLNITPVENKYIFSTPKFSQVFLDKESFNKNNSLGFDMPSFEEPKISFLKQIITKESKDKNNDLNPFKENFSLSSLLNENNNNEANKVLKEDKKINVININMENPSKKKEKMKKALISFGDKSENENNSLNNNEIIYREKANNSSILSNKDKEKDKEKEEINENQNNNNMNNSIEIKDVINAQNNSNSFQYNLPLENDVAPTASDFFIFDENDNNNNKNDNNIDNNKDKDNLSTEFKKDKEEIKLDNNPINNHTIETDRNNLDNNKNEDRKIFNTKIAYSKKKVKRSKTERQSMSHKLLFNEDIIKKINEKEIITNEYTNKNNNKQDILINSCDNSRKLKNKVKYCSIDMPYKVLEENNEIFLSGENENLNKNNPQKKLTMIQKLKLFNLPKVKEDDIVQIKKNTSRENLIKNDINCDLDIKNILKKRSAINKKINNEIYLNTSQKKYKNLKFTNYPNLFSDFQKFKRLRENGNMNTINTVRESVNYNNIINSNFFNNAINFNSTVVEQNDEQKNFIAKKKNNRRILNNNNKKQSNSRNFDNMNINYSHKIFNNDFYKTINYENPDSNTIVTTSKNSDNNYKKILINKFKAKIPIKNSIPDFKINKIKSTKLNKNKNDNNHTNYYYIRNKNINNKNKIKNETQFKMNKIRSKAEINYNKSKNLVFNNQNLTKNKQRPKKFYNKFIYNYFETNPNENYNTETTHQKNQISDVQNNNVINNEKTINKNKIEERSNFINDNSSTNSLQNSNYNKIKVHMIFNKHCKMNTSQNLFSQEFTKKYWRIYKKPKNTCLINHFNNDNNDNNSNSNKKNSFKKHINNYKSDELDFNSGNRSNKNSQIIALRKRFINGTNLTVRNSISKFENNLNEINTDNQRSSMQKLNVNVDKLYLDMKNTQTIEDYNSDLIKYSILRNNLNNKIINEFSLTVGESNNQDKKSEIKNETNNKKRININKKKTNNKKEGINDKKTIINVNQYYPSYFINAQNQNFKEKK